MVHANRRVGSQVKRRVFSATAFQEGSGTGKLTSIPECLVWADLFCAIFIVTC